MKFLICSILFSVFLSGCTAADLGTARKLTIEDGAQYLDENHQDRRTVRAWKRTIRDSVIQMYVDAAAVCKATGDIACAVGHYAAADELLNNAYPELATIELLREWLDSAKGLKVSANELRALFEE